MNKNNIWQSITRKLAGESTIEEEAVVSDWLDDDKINKKVNNRLVEVWQYNPLRIINSSGIYKKFQHRLSLYEKKQNTSRFLYYALRISAIFFFLLSTTVLVNKYLVVNKNEKLVYQEISVPKGNRTSIVLPDSSKVWLSNNSRIKYPVLFAKNMRELELTGEAYFEVTHDDKKPFIVNVGNNRVKVLGTKFSVTAYPDDNTVRADLVSGRIQFDINTGEGISNFNSYEVKPLHSLVLDKTSGKLFESKIPDGFYNYWQNGIYEFNNESLESLAKKVDRIYNMEIVFEDNSLKTKRFSGTISIDDNIFTFIEAIKRTSLEPIEYKYDKNKIYVKLK